MSLLAVGVSHQTAPVALLEQFAMGTDDRVKALRELVESDHVSEALVLATCNRIEVFAEVEKFHGGVTDVSRVLARQAGATVEELSPYVTVHYEDQAVAHLFTVAAGLDSMVVGETQVLGQLRAAYALAREEGAVGRALHPVAQRALRVGKRVHTETGIDRAGASLVSVALDRAEERIGSLDGRSVLVVGAGSMGALAATTLTRRGGLRRRQQPDRGARRAPGREPRRSGRRALRPSGGAGRRRRARHLYGRDRARGGCGRGRRRHGGRAPGRSRSSISPSPRDVDRVWPRCPACTWWTSPCSRGSGPPRRGSPPPAVAADDIAAAHALVETETALLRAERQAAEVAPTVSALRSQAAEVVDAGAAAPGGPAARPRRPRPRGDLPHRAPRRGQAPARADRPGEGTRRDVGGDRLRRCPARALRPGHRHPGRRRGREPLRGRPGRPRKRTGEAS